MDDATLARVEHQRLDLEKNIAKLRKSLRHWQTLEIDYEGLKEEFQGLPDDTSAQKCLQAARDFKPELLDDNELESLFDEKKVGRKRPSQLVEIFSKRVDYVTRNIITIRRQLSDAERKRNALLLAEDPDHQDDAGLPLSEIMEELDEDGKVVASRVQTPGKEAPDLLNVLQKTGVSGMNDNKKPELGVSTDNVDETKMPTASHVGIGVSDDGTRPNAKSRVTELSDSEEESASDTELGPTNPDDTAEDAALRQEMLQYGLNEVGAIVAELDLQDAANSDYDDDDDVDDDAYLSDYDEDEDLYTDESEDDKGATKNPIISQRYKRQMEALSKKHGISAIENLGPDPKLPKDVKENIDRPPAAEAARTAAIARAEAAKISLKTNSEDDGNDEPQKKKKKVAFAPSLDIATDARHTQESADVEPTINPVGDTVIERIPSQPTQSTAPPKPILPPEPKKSSKFKATRSSTPQTPLFPPPTMDFPSPPSSQPTAPQPTGPPGQTISHTLVERPASNITKPSDPTDFDEALHRREVAAEYQQMRNRKIHQQGGYVRGGAAENYGEELAPETVVDENTGKPRKISRFKAARLQHEKNNSAG